jgi:hypothetical protein
MKGHVINIKTKELLITSVTLNGCQVNESAIKGCKWRKEDGTRNGGFMCNHESSSKHCVPFCFASDFEKVLMEEDIGHGGMVINY